MSNPSFENIDKWLFEFVEGNLSPTQVTQLETFLLNNPEFEADLDAWRFAKVDATPVTYPGVAARKRKPIPFWVPVSLVITSVFVAGGIAGAYLNEATHQKQPVSIEAAVYSGDFKVSAHGEIALSANSLPMNVGSEQFAVTESDDEQRNSSIMTGLVPRFGINSQVVDQKPGTPVHAYVSELKPRAIIAPASAYTQPDVPSTEGNVMHENVQNVQVQIDDENNTKSQMQIEAKQEVNVDRNVTAAAMTRGSNRLSSNYNKTLGGKLKSAMRKVIRMTDNPIAFTNSKDIYYHVPAMQTLNVNAGSVGNLLQPRVKSITRAQWTGQANQQVQNELSFDTYVKSIRGGIGVQVNHQYYNKGAYNVGQLALIYSPKLIVNRNFSIEPAVRLKMGDKRLDGANLAQGQHVELERGNKRIYHNETPEKQVKDLWYKDVALALNTNTKWFSAGFQIDNLGRHYDNVYNSFGENERASMHYTAHLGTDFVSKTKIISFSPYLMYQKVENLSEIWGGSIFRYNKLTIGGAFSSGGDYAGSIGLKTNKFMLTYNADMTSSALTGTRLFSQQMTMRILINNGQYGRTTLKQ